MRGSARKYDVRMAQFVLKIEKLSHIMGPRASQDLRSPSLIMAPATIDYFAEAWTVNPLVILSGGKDALLALLEAMVAMERKGD